MRAQLLHGYVLHQRAYRERSKLVNFFSLECGRIDGVARQHLPPLYQPCVLYGNGKTGLKSFSQMEAVGSRYPLQAQALFAGFYINELLVRLLPLEEPCPELFAAYGLALEQLLTLAPMAATVDLVPILRRFEAALLPVLGIAPQFSQDAHGQALDPEQGYVYQHGVGLLPHAQGERGALLLAMNDAKTAFCPAILPFLTRMFRQILASQLGSQPLRSRELWQKSQHFSA